jgi:hypothetical protein
MSTTPATPDVNPIGATDDAEGGGLFGGTQTSFVGISATVAQSVTDAQNAANAAAATASQITADTTTASNAATAAGVSETNAANSATTASNAATNASNSATAASTSELNALASENLSEDWAIKTSGPVANGEYSSKYYAGTIATDAATANTKAAEASDDADDAQKLAINAYNVQYTLSDGVTTGYSALHHATNASTSETNALSSQTLASEWASKVNGQVDSTDYSAKAWSIGGTGVTDTAGAGPAKDWAIETTGQVDGTEYSAKEYAVGTQTRGTTGSAKDWSTYTTSTVDSSEYSAKEYAQGTQSSTGGSAKDWAIKTTADVDSVDYSSKEWAVGSQSSQANGSAKQWAIGGGSTFDRDTLVGASEYSAKYYAEQARLEAVSAAAAAGGGAVKVSSADTATGELSVKLVEGTEIKLDIVNPGGAETLKVSAPNMVAYAIALGG